MGCFALVIELSVEHSRFSHPASSRCYFLEKQNRYFLPFQSHVIFPPPETVQALMKVMAELTLQGNIRKESSSGLSPVEEYASIFIRWQQPDTDLDYFVENVPGDPPYIVCSALPFSEGQYFAVIMNSAIDCGFSFGRAFDVLLKLYKVFNFPVSGRAKKVLELFDLIYGIQGHSRLCNVNKLFEKISKAASRLLN